MVNNQPKYHCTDCGKTVKERGKLCFSCFKATKEYNRDRDSDHQNDHMHSKLTNHLINYRKGLIKFTPGNVMDHQIKSEHPVYANGKKVFVDVFEYSSEADMTQLEIEKNKSFFGKKSDNVKELQGEKIEYFNIYEIKPVIYDMGQIIRQMKDMEELVKIEIVWSKMKEWENRLGIFFMELPKEKELELKKEGIVPYFICESILVVSDTPKNREIIHDNLAYIESSGVIRQVLMFHERGHVTAWARLNKNQEMEFSEVG